MLWLSRSPKGQILLATGERLGSGIQNIFVLGEEEVLLLCAKEEFNDETVIHSPGDCWMIYGTCDYVPPTKIEIVESHSCILLDENEGIYVCDIKKGNCPSCGWEVLHVGFE